MALSEIDLSVGFFLEPATDVLRRKISDEHYVCAVRADHPTIRSSLGLDDFVRTGHAVYRPAAGSHRDFEDGVDRLFIERGMRRRVALRLANFSGISQIVATTDLLICIPSRLAQIVAGYGNIRTFPLPFEAPTVEIAQLWNRRVDRDGGHCWLRQCFLDLFATD